MDRKSSPAESRPGRYEVFGFVPKGKLTLYERKQLGGRGSGLWIRIRIVAAWSTRGAVKKVVDQGWVSDVRMTRFRASLAGDASRAAGARAARGRASASQLRLPFPEA